MQQEKHKSEHSQTFAMCAKETFSKMADFPREETEDERFTLSLLRLRKRSMEHFVFLPARTNALDIRFTVDTGSDCSLNSKNFVPQKQFQPCKQKEILYINAK